MCIVNSRAVTKKKGSANKLILQVKWIFENIHLIQEGSKIRTKREKYVKTNSKIVYLKPTIYIITLNINGLYLPIKRKKL